MSAFTSKLQNVPLEDERSKTQFARLTGGPCFAAHFRNAFHDEGGNIIALQRILGHADISQTMIYAHFAPDYLLDDVSYNLLSGISTLCPHSGGNEGDLRVS